MRALLSLLFVFSVLAAGQTCENNTNNFFGPGKNLNRTYVVCYPTGHEQDTTLPALVFIHAGGWTSGTVTNRPCPNDLIIECWFAARGWVTYDVNYTLTKPITTAGTLTVQPDGQTVNLSTYTLSSADVGSHINIVDNRNGWVTAGYSIQSVDVTANTAHLCQVGDTGCTIKADTFGAMESTTMYGFIKAGTMFPVALQDCYCFLDWFGNHAGQASPHAPGDPKNIYLWGHSSGGWFVAMMNWAPRSAFASTCGKEPIGNWTLTKVVGMSSPINLLDIYNGTDANSGLALAPIRSFLGCVPTVAGCNSTRASADHYAAKNPHRAPFLEIAGESDTTVPPTDQQRIIAAAQSFDGYTPQYATLAGEAHQLDITVNPPCAQAPACGTAGQAFAQMKSFFGIP